MLAQRFRTPVHDIVAAQSKRRSLLSFCESGYLYPLCTTFHAIFIPKTFALSKCT
nr:hypothetical protein [Brevibacillus laterosporus]